MGSDQRITKLIQSIGEITQTAGEQETTKIIPNCEIIDSAPADLTGYIIVKNELGYYIPAVKSPDITYQDGDFVNLLIIKGTEPIAFQHGSGSGTGGYPGALPLTTKGDIVTRDATDNIRLGVGDDNQVLTARASETSGLVWEDPHNLIPYAVTENLLACSLTYDESWLGGTTFNDLTDGLHGPILWRILNDQGTNANPDVSGTAGGSTDPFTRYLAIALDATAQVGAVQFIGAQKTRAYRGAVVSLSADLWATGITAIRMAVIVWTSTADTVTADVVATWGANPTLATNWAYIGTPSSITIATTRDRYSVQNLTIPTNAVNLGVFIWLPAQEVNTDVLNITRVKLEPGPVSTAFAGRDPGDELRAINRFYWKSFPLLTAPAQNAGTTGIIRYQALTAGATTLRNPTLLLPVQMRIAPTVTIYNPSAANGQIRDLSAGDTTNTTPTADIHKLEISCTGNAATAVGNNLAFHVTLDARL